MPTFASRPGFAFTGADRLGPCAYCAKAGAHDAAAITSATKGFRLWALGFKGSSRSFADLAPLPPQSPKPKAKSLFTARLRLVSPALELQGSPARPKEPPV